MADKHFSIELAKLVIAAAWADGEIQIEELNTLKHLMLGLPNVDSSDWRELELYLDHPITESEFTSLLENLLGLVSSRADKDLVISTLTALVEADGIVTAEEAEMLETVRQALDAHSTGIIGRVMRTLTKKARQTVREDRMADYVGNPVYFRLSNSLDELVADEDTLRNACLAAGMMAKVACADDVVASSEVVMVDKHLRTEWGLTRGDAAVLCQVGIARELEKLDVYRLGESLKKSAPEQRRRKLLAALFRIAEADDLGDAEAVELRKISKSLGLTHRDFIAAKTAGKAP